MGRLRSTISIFIFLLVIASGPLASQEVFKAQRLTGPIIFDGIPDEPAWEKITPLEHGVYQPVWDGEHTERTDMLLAYDDTYLYVAGRMFVSDPSFIMDTGKQRDTFKANIDYLGVILDTFNDNENALSFFTTPSGLRLDFTVFNDAQGAFPLNASWNTFWDAKTVKRDDGWFAEIRIPWSSLRFQDDNGKVIMGLIIWRRMPAKNEIHTFPLTRNDFGRWSNFKPSQGIRVQFDGVYSKKPVYLAPYMLGGIQQDAKLNGNGDKYENKTEPDLNMGFDLKYGLTTNMTMDITVNTDFAQVEADDEQVNLTRFSLFFPEKRLFFQERSSTFSFNMGGPQTIFYSRRIGLYQGKIIPIIAGIRIVGRTGPWDIGFLDMQTANTDILPSTNYGVLRLRRQVINSQTYVGGIIANQIDVNGRYNTAVGIDGIFRLYEDHFLQLNYAQIYETGGVTTPFTNEHGKLRVNLQRRSNRGFGYDVSYDNSGPNYNPEMGFEFRRDITRIGNRLWWGWLPGESSWFYSHSAYLSGSQFKNNGDWSTQSSDFGPGWEFSSKNSWQGNVLYQWYEEGISDTFKIGDAEIPSGRYFFNGFTGFIQTPFTKPFSLGLSTYLGSFYDGDRVSVGLNPGWSPSSSFELGLRYEYNRGTFPSRNQEYEIHIGSVRTLLMFSTELSAALLVQYNSDVNEIGTNLRIRYNPKEGNDLYIVYNDIVNTERFREVPNLPFSSVRTFVVKYTYTFTWGR